MNNNKANYQYNCVSPKSLSELNYIIDNSKEITYKTFLKHCSYNDIKQFNQEFCIPIHQDYAVSFYKSKLKSGKLVYYFKHSGIEYVFY